jgi:hypothetical protein
MDRTRHGLRAIFSFGCSLLLCACDFESSRFQKLTQRPIEEQLSSRMCPAVGNVSAVDRGSLPEHYSIGPYTLTLPDGGYRDIQAHSVRRAGDTEYVNGVKQKLTTAKTSLHFWALGPDMFGGNFVPSAYARERSRGNLYLVDVTVFWTPDERYVPDRFVRSSEPTTDVRQVTGDLVAQEMSEPAGYRTRYFPKDKSRRYAIECRSVDPHGAGSCDVVRQLRGDVWLAYSFASVDLKCWEDLEKGITSFLNRATTDWHRNER